MTVIYSKSTGKIHGLFSGNLQHIKTLYPDEYQDYEQIWDEITLDDDQNVLNSPVSFKVNVETKQLELLPQYNKYVTQ